MKRAPTSAPGSPAAKKQKIAPAPDAPASGAAGGTGAGASGNGGGDGEWTRVERRKSKKAKKVAAIKDNAPPRFAYAPGEIQKRKQPVGIADIRDLVLHLTADGAPPGWVRVDNVTSIEKVVVLLVPGLTPEHLSLPPLPTSATENPHMPLAIPDPTHDCVLPFISQTFSHACPTRAPGDAFRMHSIMSEFFTGPVVGEEKKRRQDARVKSEQNADKDPSRYCVSLEDMIENEYPIPSYMADVFQKPEGWVETPLAPSNEDDATPLQPPRILSVDCEMCQTEDGNELARICIIDYRTKKVIYDQLVKPAKPITDYLTRWSGITAEKLEPVTTTLADVQKHLLSLLAPVGGSGGVPILLGHSLESDLRALKLAHPRVIDTALSFHHPRGRPMKPGLAWLARKWLNRYIQNRGDGGHDPEEDARACLDLLRKKVENGPGFGEFKTDFESIFARMARSTTRRAGGVRSVVADHGKPDVMHGSKASACIACKSDDEVLEGLLGAIPSHDFAFGRFSIVAETCNWISQKATPDAPAPPPPTEPTEAEVATALRTLDAQLARVHAALPARTALVLFTGHADPRPMAALAARKSQFEQYIRLGIPPHDIVEERRWTAADGRALEEEVERAKRGLLFLCVK